MWDIIKDCWRVIRRRDSESACCAMIGMSDLLTDRDLRQMRDYFDSLLKSRETK